MSNIASGSIAERTSLGTIFFFVFLVSSLIFPMALAWTWEDGWLANLGFKDFAGAGIVHLTGGITGFIGALVVGPRVGLFY
jgi:Amt family ammonium transporter